MTTTTTTTPEHRFLLSLVPGLEHKRIVLASQSPRRIELLRQTGWTFDVVPSTVDESLLDPAQCDSPTAYASELAYRKACDVYAILDKRGAPLPDVIISADTIVTAGSEIFNKPVTRAEAVSMLLRLARLPEHHVVTAVCLLFPAHGTPCVRFETVAAVELAKLTRAQAEAYVDVNESMDKAGAYAYQGLAALFVQGIRGSFHTVIGLPIARIVQELARYYAGTTS